MVKAWMYVNSHACAYAEFLVNMKEIGWIYMSPLEYMLGHLHGMNEWIIDAFGLMSMDEMMYYIHAKFFF